MLLSVSKIIHSIEMVEINVNLVPYESLSWKGVAITLLILSIPKFLEIFLLNFKKHYEPASLKKIQTVIITSAPVFQKLNQDINELKRDTLYYLGKKPTKKDELISLVIFFGFSLIAVYGLPNLEVFILNRKLEHYNFQNEFNFWMFAFENMVYVFYVISIAGIMLIYHRRDIGPSIFYNLPHSISNTFLIVSTERQFRKLRIYSYLLLFVSILGVVQLLVILSVGDRLIHITTNNEVPRDLVGSIILLGLLILLWIVSYITANRMISRRILINRLVTLLEIRNLPYAKLGLSNGNIVEGSIFNPFTDKTYLVMIDSEDITTKLFIPWKRIEWLELRT